MAVVVNPDEQVSDYVRTAIESGFAMPALYNVTGELGRPNISVNAPIWNNNRLLVYLAVGVLIWWLFFRKGR